MLMIDRNLENMNSALVQHQSLLFRVWTTPDAPFPEELTPTSEDLPNEIRQQFLTVQRQQLGDLETSN